MAREPAGAPLCAAARAAQRLGLLGGSFDPPHLGHLHAARCARTAFALDHVVFVPACHPPHKLGRRLADGAARLEMLALLLEGEPDGSCWDVELTRRGPSYTLDTLLELRRQVPAATRLYLVLGADNRPGFPLWRGVEEIVRLAQPIVVERAGEPTPGDEERAALERLSPFARTRLELGRLRGATLEASSSELRAALAAGVSAGPLPERLAEYLRARRLYTRA